MRRQVTNVPWKGTIVSFTNTRQAFPLSLYDPQTVSSRGGIRLIIFNVVINSQVSKVRDDTMVLLTYTNVP